MRIEVWYSNPPFDMCGGISETRKFHYKWALCIYFFIQYMYTTQKKSNPLFFWREKKITKNLVIAKNQSCVFIITMVVVGHKNKNRKIKKRTPRGGRGPPLFFFFFGHPLFLLPASSLFSTHQPPSF